MKKILYLMALPLAVMSCNKDDNNEKKVEDKPKVEMKEVVKVESGEQVIVVESKDGKLYQGYNSISVRVQDKEGKDVKVEKVEFEPMMTMVKMNFKHTCPHSGELRKDGDFFKGYALFQMPTGKAGYWEFNFKYYVGGKEYKATSEKVVVSDKKGLYSDFKSFMGSDKRKYFISLVEHAPVIGENKDVKIAFFRVKAGEVVEGVKALEFEIPKELKLSIDPRMAGEEMRNHSTEYGELVLGEDGYYHVRINYSMGGNWTLNFLVTNEKGEVVGGSKVDEKDVNSKSSIAIEVDVPNRK